jgi:ATP-dependent RNA helicase MSS116
MKILGTLPKREVVDRQTLLFTATVPDGLRKVSTFSTISETNLIARSLLSHSNPVTSSSPLFPKTPTTPTSMSRRKSWLWISMISLLLPARYSRGSRLKDHSRVSQFTIHTLEHADIIVMAFLPTARSASIFNEIFSNMQLSYPTWEIHSRMSQSARGKATEQFREAKEGVLFSSDVTARGIDVKGVTAVVQVGLPSNEEQCECFIKSWDCQLIVRHSSAWSNCQGRRRRTWYPNPWPIRRTLPSITHYPSSPPTIHDTSSQLARCCPNASQCCSQTRI